MDDYKKTFSNVAKSHGASFKFADEQITSQHILQKITNYIRDHDFSLFDVTGWNPNVSLELGIAIGLAKKYFILLNTAIDKNKEVPSDIKGFDRIQYASNSELAAKLSFLINQEQPKPFGKTDDAFAGLKQSIGKILRTSPGLGLSKLAEATSIEKAIVQSTVHVMIQNGELKTRGKKKGTTYFTADTDLRSFRE